MERHVLIAGRSSAVLETLAEEALGDEVHLLRTLDAGQNRPQIASPHADSAAFTIWNRRSPLSARSVVIRAINVLETIDEAYVVYASTEEGFQAFHEMSPADIEHKIDSDVKGYIFLVKEILAQFSRQKSGTVTLVLQHPASSLGSPLEAASASAFRSIGDQLFTAYQNEAFQLRGFETTAPDAKEFVRYLLAAGREKTNRSRGRWLRFGGKGGLFSFGR